MVTLGERKCVVIEDLESSLGTTAGDVAALLARGADRD